VFFRIMTPVEGVFFRDMTPGFFRIMTPPAEAVQRSSFISAKKEERWPTGSTECGKYWMF
jgi:hypothetical protein